MQGETNAPVALVTGAAGIVAPGIIRTLRMLGWKVAGAGTSAESFLRYEQTHNEPHPAHLRLYGDLAQQQDCARIVREAREGLGSLSLVVNCATAAKRPTPLAELKREDIENLFAVDLFAIIYLAQEALADLRQNSGQIINLSSVRAFNQVPGNVAYATAKAATEKLTEAMALELVADKVRVNCIRVGAIPGDAFLRPALAMLPEALARRLYDDILPKHLADVGRTTSTTRPGTAEDVGEMVAYLASPKAQFINGTTLCVDGGFGITQQLLATAHSRAAAPSLAIQWAADPAGCLRQWLKEQNIDHDIDARNPSAL